MTVKYFSIPVRVYWEDTDAGGVVYHSQYVNFAERARTEWVRNCGIASQKTYADETGILLVVKKLTIDYKVPAVLDDILEVSCDVFEMKNASVTFKQTVTRGDILLAELFVTIASINGHGRPTRLPKELQQQ